MRHIACVVGLMVLAMVTMAGSAHADVIVSWDWNDGTTQGWQSNSTGIATNVLGRLLVTNTRNGSL